MQVDVNDTERSKALSISAEDIETRSSGRRTIPLGGVLNRPVPEEAVLLWITSTIERDYERRVAFPELRANIAQGRQANSSLHILSLEDAQNVLADALETKLRKRGGWLTAYGAYVKSIESAIEGARERKKLFQSAVAVCDYRCAQYERWYGTKPQLQKEGFSLAGPWPGEDGGKRWGAGRDRRGYKARVKTYSSLWRMVLTLSPTHARSA